MDSIAGNFSLDWSREGLDRITRTELKKYNAEGHSQQTIEGMLELRGEHSFSASDVLRIEIETFDVAYNIIGGGEEGDKTVIENKEQADHGLHYMVAVALLDGQVMPEQYTSERIHSRDVQELMKRVVVRPNDAYSERFPDEMPTLMRVTLRDGSVLVAEKTDYEGFHSNPMRWETVVEKFERLSEPYTEAPLRTQIIEAVSRLDGVPVEEFVELLARVRIPTD